MSKVVWHITMSVDGFIAGPGDAMDWAFGHSDEPSAIADGVLRDTGAILGGRRWHDGAMEHHDGLAGVYGGNWSGPVLVLTHHPGDEAGEGVTFISGSVEVAVAGAREAAGGRDVVVFGANLAAQCIDAGLDEIVIHVAPVLLGDGVRLYGEAATDRVALELVEQTATGQYTDLRYRVIR